MHLDEAEARNTMLRKKVENVGRPEDDTKDAETSKLAKQAEIKKKIIDEALVGHHDFEVEYEKKKYSGDPHTVKKTETYKVPKEFHGQGVGSHSSIMKRIKDHPESAAIHTKHREAGFSVSEKPIKFKGTNEETVIEAMGEIQDLVKVDKKPKDSDSEKDPMKITGGKTEVDLKPVTNDAPENQNMEDDKSKKTTKEENKKIGAKGVKEETMSGKLTFGSSQSQINAVTEAMKMMKGVCPKCGKVTCQCDGDPKVAKEELVGGQKKLDANHNGKIDAEDFKLLKAKKMKEEVESINELDRDGMVKRYADKARKKVEGGEESSEKRAAGRLMAGQKRWGGAGGIPAAKVPAVQREEVEFSEAELARINEILKSL